MHGVQREMLPTPDKAVSCQLSHHKRLTLMKRCKGMRPVATQLAQCPDDKLARWLLACLAIHSDVLLP